MVQTDSSTLSSASGTIEIREAIIPEVTGRSWIALLSNSRHLSDESDLAARYFPPDQSLVPFHEVIKE